MNSTPWRLSLALCALSVAAVGCGDDPVVTPDDGSADAGFPTDNATPTDLGFDVGTPTDVPADGGTPMDAALDVGTPIDAADKDGGLADAIVVDVPTTDVADVPAVDVLVDGGVMCPAPRDTITLPSATPIALMGTTIATGGIVPSTRCQSNTSGGEAFYNLVVTARTGVILSLDNAGTSFDTELSIRRVCNDATTELSCDDDSGTGSGRTNSSVMRAVLDPGTYSVVVDGYNGQFGTYALTASTFTPADNATCATARALTVGTALTGQTFANAGGPGLCTPGVEPGGQLFYTVTLPANTVGTALVTRASGSWGYAVRVYAGCDATSCVQFASSSSSTLSQPFANATTSPRTFIVSVAQMASADTSTSFDLVVNTAALSAGQACEDAVALVPGTPLTGQSNAGAPFTAAPCRTGDVGGQRFYSLTIPAGQRARVTATPVGTTPRQPVLRLRDECSSTTCIDSTIGGTSGTPAPAILDIPNAGTAAITVVVSLSSTSATTEGSWDLSATTAPIVAGQFCATPVAVTAGMTLSAQDARNGLRTTTPCVSAANGGQLFYRVTVPSGSRVPVRAVPAGAMMAWTPTLRVLSSCTSTSCVANNTAAASGGAATVTLTNGGAMAQDYLVSVAGSAAASGTFDLEVGAPVLLPGYTVTTITAACDDVTTGTAVTRAAGGDWGDDNSSDIAALPFTLTFFGDAATRWSMASNGFLQLYAATGGSTSTEYVNYAIPDSDEEPDGFVAPFWDDLRTVDDDDNQIATARTITLGTAPARRFVTQWTNFTDGDGLIRLTFQAKLFEGTNVIELHYCSITAGDERASGNSATIGAESLTSEYGTQVSYNTADAVVTGRAYRLTPR